MQARGRYGSSLPMSDGKKPDTVQSLGGSVLIQVGAHPDEPDRGDPDPTNAQKAFVLGQLAMDRGEWEEAEARFAEAAELDWTQAMFVEWQDEARSRLTERDPVEDVEDVEDPGTAPPPSLAMPTSSLVDETSSSGTATNPRTVGLEDREAVQRTIAERYHRLGERAQSDGDLIEALVQFERALQIFPKNPRYIYAVNRVKADLGPERLAEVEARRSEAEETLRAETERKEKNAERYFKRGERARRRGVFGEAVQCLEGAVRLQPGNVRYQEALQDARAKLRAESTLSKARPSPKDKAKDAAPAPVAAAPKGPPLLEKLPLNRRQLLMTVLAVLLLGYAALSGGVESVEDVALDHAEVATFVRLNEASSGWYGELAEPLTGLTGRALQARCDEVAGGLPGGGLVVLTGSDGGSVICAGD